jgi:hypothetical protein
MPVGVFLSCFTGVDSIGLDIAPPIFCNDIGYFPFIVCVLSVGFELAAQCNLAAYL